jgi:hypothetical protein
MGGICPGIFFFSDLVLRVADIGSKENGAIISLQQNGTVMIGVPGSFDEQQIFRRS